MVVDELIVAEAPAACHLVGYVDQSSSSSVNVRVSAGDHPPSETGRLSSSSVIPASSDHHVLASYTHWQRHATRATQLRSRAGTAHTRETCRGR